MELAAVWAVIEYLMNGVVFLLIGLQLESVVDGLPPWPLEDIAGYVLAISGVVLGVRLLWVFPASRATSFVRRRLGGQGPSLAWQSQVVMGWAGMRGVISLAAALALPATIHGGAPFPDRSVIVFLTFSVILTTLILNGLTLPLLIRRLRASPDEAEEESEIRARLAIGRAGIDELDRRAAEGDLSLTSDEVMALRGELSGRVQGIEARAGTDEPRAEVQRVNRAYREILHFERRELERLTRARRISRDIAHRIELDIDLEESRTAKQLSS